jgi:ribosomal protein S18 acetylase RimI-like enzyme
MQITTSLRSASPSELPIVADFWLAMFEEIGKYSEGDFEPGWRDRFVDYFAPRLAREDARYFVAVDGERIVGSAGARLTEGYPSAIHGLRSGYIFGVYVLPEYRRLGLATRLTQATVEFLREKNARTIRLHASLFGRPIYEKMGFTPTNEMQM